VAQTNFLGLEPEFTNLQDAPTVIIPVPYEQTVSYGGGTEKGPGAILEASAYVELYDEELDGEIYRSGIHTAEAVSFEGDVETDFRRITNTFQKYLELGKFPVGLGGEHSLSFPVYRAFHQYYKGDISVLQFDAHSDLRESYEGSEYSHASVMKRIYDMNESIVQVGIRAQCVEEAELIRNRKIATHYAHNLNADGFTDEIIEGLKENVFITFDVDYFDPAIMPSTGTPEPGGFHWYETIDFLRRVFKNRNVVGFDVVELSPIEGLNHAEFTVAKLIYKMIGMKYLLR